MTRQEAGLDASMEYESAVDSLYRNYCEIAGSSLVPSSFHNAFRKEVAKKDYYHIFGGLVYVNWVGISESLFRDGMRNGFTAQYALLHADAISLVKIEKEMDTSLPETGAGIKKAIRDVATILIELENVASGSGITGWSRIPRKIAFRLGFGASTDQLKEARGRVEEIFEDKSLVSTITLKSMSRYVDRPKGYFPIPHVDENR